MEFRIAASQGCADTRQVARIESCHEPPGLALAGRHRLEDGQQVLEPGCYALDHGVSRATGLRTKDRWECRRQSDTWAAAATQYAISCYNSNNGRGYWKLPNKEDVRCREAKSGGTSKTALVENW